jgi:N-acetylmuramoyl-L-alanine amidase
LFKTFNIEKKLVSEPQGKLYRVQIGAYSKKENAQVAVEKAKVAGFKDAFIRYE